MRYSTHYLGLGVADLRSPKGGFHRTADDGLQEDWRMLDSGSLPSGRFLLNMDHHHLPRFHLAKWSDANGQVVRWGRVRETGKITRRLLAPDATAYVPDLYALQDVPKEKVHAVEQKVFGTIDGRAAQILDLLIERGATALDYESRQFWALYLNASVARVPHNVSAISKQARELLVKILSEPDEAFNAAKGDAPEATLLEWVENHAPAQLSNSGMMALTSFLGLKRPIERLLSFECFVRDVGGSSRSLLIGDEPFGRVGDLYQSNCLVRIPLSPGRAFFATNSRRIAESIKAMSDRKVVNASNITSVSSAKKFVYGEAEETFIDRYLLKEQGDE